MNSRETILSTIRSKRRAPVELPTVAGEWTTYPDPALHFCEALAGVGGQAVSVADAGELDAAVRALAVMQDAPKVICRVPGMSLGNVDLDTLDLPQHVHDIDVGILTGEFGVAENAAVWVTDAGIRHRVVYFLPQHLVLVVPRAQIVNHMHEAYAKLQFPGAGYGLFISGPSKTADIEQSLVIGAHGPRSLTVVLVGAYDTNVTTSAQSPAGKPISTQFDGY